MELVRDADMDEERRGDESGRRATDGQIVRAADTAISIGWRWMQILATLIGFGFMAGVYYFQSVAEQKATAAMQLQLTSIDAKLNAMDRTNVGRDKDIDFLKEQRVEDRRDLRGEIGLLEARIIAAEKALARLDARN